MKMSTSSKNLRESSNMNFDLKKDYKKGLKKIISLKDDYFKIEIYKKLNEGSVLNFIRNSSKKDTVKTNFSETSKPMKYDLTMINKYDEDLNSSLSFISEFDLENEENGNNDSFNSSFDENSFEEIDIAKKVN